MYLQRFVEIKTVYQAKQKFIRIERDWNETRHNRDMGVSTHSTGSFTASRGALFECTWRAEMTIDFAN